MPRPAGRHQDGTSNSFCHDAGAAFCAADDGDGLVVDASEGVVYDEQSCLARRLDQPPEMASVGKSPGRLG